MLTRDVLIDRIWGSDYFGDTKTLDVHIKRLRTHIEVDPSKPRLITTIRGLGYRFESARRHVDRRGHRAVMSRIAPTLVAPEGTSARLETGSSTAMATETREDLNTDRPWLVIVWNDPVNLMSYVTYVFQKLFGYSLPKATRPDARRTPQGSCRRRVRPEGKSRARRLAPPQSRVVGDAGAPELTAPDRPPVLVRSEGGFDLSLSPDERALLSSLPGQLSRALEAVGETDAQLPEGLRRGCSAAAYPTHQRPPRRTTSASCAVTSSNTTATPSRHSPIPRSATDLSDDETSAWLAAVNDLRIVLGASLGVTEETVEPARQDPQYAEWIATTT